MSLNGISNKLLWELHKRTILLLSKMSQVSHSPFKHIKHLLSCASVTISQCYSSKISWCFYHKRMLFDFADHWSQFVISYVNHEYILHSINAFCNVGQAMELFNVKMFLNAYTGLQKVNVNSNSGLKFWGTYVGCKV